MAHCQLCESSRAHVVDVEIKPVDDPWFGGVVVRLAAITGVEVTIVPTQMIQCDDCGGRYSNVRLPLCRKAAKKYLRNE